MTPEHALSVYGHIVICLRCGAVIKPENATYHQDGTGTVIAVSLNPEHECNPRPKS